MWYGEQGCRCSCGTHVREIDMPASHGAYIRDKAMMNQTDCKVGLEQNIPPFGACKSKTKGEADIQIEDTKDLVPSVDENGNPIKPSFPIEGKLCEPQLAERWFDTQDTMLVDGQPALTVKSTITCKYGGIILEQPVRLRGKMPLVSGRNGDLREDNLRGSFCL